ncbi:hypothetical protein SDJN02_09955, partial [Cucurbita argyrosperma subsp. argyrosperma]
MRKGEESGRRELLLLWLTWRLSIMDNLSSSDFLLDSSLFLSDKGFQFAEIILRERKRVGLGSFSPNLGLYWGHGRSKQEEEKVRYLELKDILIGPLENLSSLFDIGVDVLYWAVACVLVTAGCSSVIESAGTPGRIQEILPFLLANHNVLALCLLSLIFELC